MPVVADFRCPALKERHWEKIFDALEMEIDVNDPDFKLKTLIDM